MLPEIWIFDTYSLMLFIGVIACLFVFNKFSKKNKEDDKFIYSIEIIALISIICGLLSATLFQTIFDLLKGNNTNPLSSMTFFGGLAGGVLVFILLYFLYIKKKFSNGNFLKILIIAPGCITIAHGFGRIGCFLAGCCYGIKTDSWLGVKFPNMDYKVYPTQLFEALFLFILSAVLIYLAFKYQYKYNMVIYLFSYGTFRFLIEFIRGDERGVFLLNLSPSQWFSIICILIGISLIFLLRKKKIDK